jgi:hypothetical protein
MVNREKKQCTSELRNEIKTKRIESYLTKNINIAKLFQFYSQI